MESKILEKIGIDSAILLIALFILIIISFVIIFYLMAKI